MTEKFTKALDTLERRMDNKINTLVSRILEAIKQPNISGPSQNSLPMGNLNSQISTPIAIQSDQFPHANITYAQAIQNAHIPSEAIRNIQVLGDDMQCKIVMDRIRKDDICAQLPIKTIANNRKQNLTINCADVKAADELENLLTNKYRDTVKITKIVPIPPRVKITPLFTDISDSAEVLHHMITQNQWLATHQIDIEAFYTISSNNVQYKTMIIKCSAELLHLLARKRIIFGLQQCRCYEQVDVLQCLKCQRFGHFARECTMYIRYGVS